MAPFNGQMSKIKSFPAASFSTGNQSVWTKERAHTHASTWAHRRPSELPAETKLSARHWLTHQHFEAEQRGRNPAGHREEHTEGADSISCKWFLNQLVLFCWTSQAADVYALARLQTDSQTLRKCWSWPLDPAQRNTFAHSPLPPFQRGQRNGGNSRFNSKSRQNSDCRSATKCTHFSTPQLLPGEGKAKID